MTSPSDCRICGKTKEAHKNYRHAFVADGDNANLSQGNHGNDQVRDASSSSDPATQGRVRIPTAGDPVLRMALIRAGVVSVADIEAVEAELRATGVAGYDPDKTLG